MAPAGDFMGDAGGADGPGGMDGTELGTGRARKAQRRERLLTTATDLFTTRGYAATSIERICATAHVSIRAFYEEFEGREALLIALHNAVARAGMEATLAAVGDPALKSAGTRRRVSALIGAYVAAVTADPAAARVAFVEVIGVNRAVEDHRRIWRSLWTDFLAEEAERAVVRGEAPPRDHTLAMVALIGAINELVAHWARGGGLLSREVLAEEMTRHVLATIGIHEESHGGTVPSDGTALSEDTALFDGAALFDGTVPPAVAGRADEGV